MSRSRTLGKVPAEAERVARPAQVSCKSAEHYTPVEYADAAHYVLGAIDLDPASCAAANKRIRARQYYTKAQCGQHRPWFGRVWINPPGDKLGELVPAFWRAANKHALTGGPGVGVLWAGFTLEQLRSLQNAGDLADGRPCPAPGDWPRVVIGGGAPQASSGGRIYWIDGATGKPGKQPTHGNFFALLGGDAGMRARFRERFGQWGDYCPGRRGMLARRDLGAELVEAASGCPSTCLELARAVGARTAEVIRVVTRLEQQGRLRRRKAGRRLLVEVA